MGKWIALLVFILFIIGVEAWHVRTDPNHITAEEAKHSESFINSLPSTESAE